MSTELVVLAVFAMRLLVPLLILRFPLPGIVAAILADAVDGAIFSGVTGAPLDGYQNFDKALDAYYLAIAFIAMRRNWTDPFAQRLGAGLWYVRLVGVALFSLSDERALLLLFPATFELFFIYYEVARTRWDPARLSARHLLTVAAASWVLIKLPQEYWIHVARGSTTEWLKTELFGVTADASRWEAVTAAPAVGMVLAGSMLAVALVAVETLRAMGPADHPTTFDADAHPGVVRAIGTPSGAVRGRSPATAMGEKVVIVALLAISFAEFLPGVDTTVRQMVLAAGLAVLATTLVRPRLSRSGLHPALAPAVLAVASLPAIALTARLTEASIDAATTVFYALLFTLLAELYDRAEETAAERVGAAARHAYS